MTQLRTWLTADTPTSRNHARAIQAYLSWRALASNPLTVIGLLIVVALVVFAALAPLLAPQSPIAVDLTQRFIPPGAQHLFGTDEFGRDILSRVLYGARVTLYIVVLEIGRAHV